jgi:hypothetical protein
VAAQALRERDDSALQATVNPDLTTLLTIVLLGDQPFGPPPGELLDPVLMDDCVEAMVSDIDVFMDEFEGRYAEPSAEAGAYLADGRYGHY